MTEHGPETLDQYGLRVGRELDALSSVAVGPFDPVAIAHEIAVASPRPSHPFPLRRVAPNVVSLSRPRLRLLAVALATTALLAALAGVSFLAGGTDPAPISTASEIAFVSSTYTCGDEPCVLQQTSDRIRGLRAEAPGITSAPGAGGEPRPLVDIPGSSHRPTGWSLFDPRSSWLSGPSVRWSPDGTRLAFRLFNDAPGIYLVDRDGSGLSRLVDLSLDHDTGMGPSAGLAWSPDGRHIAYTYPYGGLQSPLHVVDTADGHVTDLGVLATRAVAWSPDGSRIAFVQSDPGNAESANVSGLVVIDADGSGATPLADTFMADYHVGAIDWSPDGSRIAFGLSGDSRSTARGRPDRSGLYSIAPDGTSLLRLTEPDPGNDDEGGGCCIHIGGGGQLAWSPDGLQVAGVAPMVGFGPGIVVANADGSAERRFGPPSAYAIDWSPDGSRLVYAAGAPWTAGWDARQGVSTDDWSAIYLIDADGTNDTWLADGEFPDWSSGRG